jgi:hypothetical protein
MESGYRITGHRPLPAVAAVIDELAAAVLRELSSPAS